MMKKSVYILLLLLTSAFAAYSQRLGKPSLNPVAPTAVQQKTINEGTALHDLGKYAEAVEKYRSVLAESPDCAAAMYEMALSMYHKGDKLESIELAYKGTKYIADELPLFYVLIANALDDAGKPADAITIYKDGLKLLSGETKFRHYRSSLNYNLGVTLVRQKKYTDARTALKSAVEDDPLYASPHYLLSVVFQGTKYKIPGMLAAARLVSLEFNTQRTVNSAALIAEVLKPAAKDPKTGNMTINLDFLAPTDEGEFGKYEILLPTLLTVKDEKDKDKTENQIFADALGSVFAMLAENKKLKNTFVGRNYIPFVTELKNNGHLEAFANLVIFINDRKNAEASKWIEANETKMRSFFEWAKTYQPPSK